MKKYKLIFCGTPKIGLPVLKYLNESELFEVCLVITQPDKPQGRKRKIKFSKIKQYSIDNNIKIAQPYKIIDLYEDLIKINYDFMLTFAFGQFIPNKILELCDMNLNIHASLLPLYRGGSPIRKAILDNQDKTGVSLMHMIKKMDAGNVIDKKEIAILNEYNNSILNEKIAIVALELIKNSLYKSINEKSKGIAQNEENVTYAYNFDKSIEKLNFNQSSILFFKQIQALSDAPGAYCYINDKKIKLFNPILLDTISNGSIGEILDINKKGMLIKLKDKDILIQQCQIEGKKITNPKSYLNNIIKIGDILK